MFLTISIPTYNRPQSILATVKSLLPQLTDDVCIRVLDNCSEVDIKALLQNEIDFSKHDIEVIRAPINVGADVNFQRCFEISNAEYTWLLGDDDTINEDAIAIIRAEIGKYRDVDMVGINFASNCLTKQRSEAVFVGSLEDLGTKLDHFGNWLFISTTVYRTNEYKRYLHYSVWGTYALASQLVAPIYAISNNKVLILSEKYIVTNVATSNVAQQWHNIPVTLGLLSLLEAPVGFKNKEHIGFGKKMSVQFVSFTDLLCAVVKSVQYDLDKVDAYHLYLIGQVYHRTIKFRPKKLVSVVSYRVVLFLLHVKPLLQLYIRLNRKFRERIEAMPGLKLFAR